MLYPSYFEVCQVADLIDTLPYCDLLFLGHLFETSHMRVLSFLRELFSSSMPGLVTWVS